MAEKEQEKNNSNINAEKQEKLKKKSEVDAKDEELKNEDYSLYTAIASTIIFIFSIVIENTMNVEVTKK